MSREPLTQMDLNDAAGGLPPIRRVLIVDDDPSMQRMVSAFLEDNGIRAAVANNKLEMSRMLAAGRFNLVLLDLRLGQEDGLDLLRELQAHAELPVIIMTGHRRDEADRVIGLELGADDYVTKPFSLRELLARIRAVLRRVDAAHTEPRDSGAAQYRFGSWLLDRKSRRLTGADCAAIGLTKSEYALLMAFLATPQQVLSRELLLQATRIHEDVFDRSIDVQILRLRRKLEDDPSDPRIILTHRGQGYIFTLPVEMS